MQGAAIKRFQANGAPDLIAGLAPVADGRPNKSA
jgi:hypothetical protein